MQTEHTSGTASGPSAIGYDVLVDDSSFPSRRQAARSQHSPATLFEYAVLKRAIDILLVLIAAPLLVPVLLLIGISVVLSSPGPVFFSHRRIGIGGTFFSMWKFRTMCVNSAEVLEQHLSAHPEERREWSATHKLRCDPRVTPLGNFLRKSSLDELPQVWNVLTGKMSLVGPRPIVAAEAEKYGEHFPFYLAVRPGITGLWQTSGRSTVSYEERVAMDRRYVETWSLQQDCAILLRTASKVANSEGAY